MVSYQFASWYANTRPKSSQRKAFIKNKEVESEILGYGILKGSLGKLEASCRNRLVSAFLIDEKKRGFAKTYLLNQGVISFTFDPVCCGVEISTNDANEIHFVADQFGFPASRYRSFIGEGGNPGKRLDEMGEFDIVAWYSPDQKKRELSLFGESVEPEILSYNELRKTFQVLEFRHENRLVSSFSHPKFGVKTYLLKEGVLTFLWSNGSAGVEVCTNNPFEVLNVSRELKLPYGGYESVIKSRS